ncbi:hypothetical protein, partial [Borreliella garinii]|uniref:hypothetical protein n=1 Tax=Borreliella garinii TaxID=29519 RepID=UPI0034DADAAA
KNILLEKANLDKSNSQNLLIKLVENNHKKTCTDTVKVSYVESLIKKSTGQSVLKIKTIKKHSGLSVIRLVTFTEL